MLNMALGRVNLFESLLSLDWLKRCRSAGFQCLRHGHQRVRRERCTKMAPAFRPGPP